MPRETAKIGILPQLYNQKPSNPPTRNLLTRNLKKLPILRRPCFVLAGVEFAVFARVFLVFRANGGFEDAAGLIAGHVAVGGLFFRLLVLLLLLGLLRLVLWLRLLLGLVVGLLLRLILLLLLLFLLFLLLFLPFLFGHLQVHLGIRVAGPEAKAALVCVYGFFELLLFEIRIAKVMESIGAHARVFGFAGRLVKIIFRGSIIALLVNGITGVVADDGIVLFFLGGLPVCFFRFAVMRVLILPVALPL